MAAIAERGRLIVGVDQNTDPFGFRDPGSGRLQGFDIDLAREIARAIFGDPDRIDLQVVEAGQRESALESGQVDLIVRTFSITCERKQNVDFSTTYFYANQKILATKGSQIRFRRSIFPANGSVRCRYDVTVASFRTQPKADRDRGDQLDRLPPDVAARTGRRHQHR